MPSPLALAAALTWTGTLVELRAVLRHPTPALRAYWCVLLLLSLAITVQMPTVYRWTDALLGYPNVARLLSNAAVVLALGSILIAVSYALVAEPHGRRLRRAAAVEMAGAPAAMTALFFWTGPLPQALDLRHHYAVPGITAYRLVYLAAAGSGFTTATLIWLHRARHSPTRRLRLAFALMTLGGGLGVLYVGNEAATLAAALGREPALSWDRVLVSDVLVALAILSLVLGATASRWLNLADELRAHRASVRLGLLWRELGAAQPEAMLLPERPRWRELLEVPGAGFRLTRRVVEIRDACVLAGERAGPGAVAAAEEVARTLHLPPAEAAALAEAVRLRLALRPPEHLPPAPDGHARAPSGAALLREADPEEGDLWGEVDYLVRVSRHLQGSRPLREALDRLAWQESGA